MPPKPPPLPPLAQDLKAFPLPTTPPQDFLDLVFVIIPSLLFTYMFVCIIGAFLSCALPWTMAIL
jgi:hypothetical protein